MYSGRLNLKNPMKRKWSLTAAALVLLVYAAQAVHMLPLSIQQLSDKAQLVLHGTVAKQTVQRDPEGRIYTRVELEVADVWKGDIGLTSFIAVQAGGRLGEEVVTLDGQEEFSVGEEVVLFLVLNQRGEGVVIGLAQGKFKVAQEPGGEKSVRNRFHGLAPGEAVKAIAKEKQRLSLRDLRARVKGRRL